MVKYFLTSKAGIIIWFCKAFVMSTMFSFSTVLNVCGSSLRSSTDVRPWGFRLLSMRIMFLRRGSEIRMPVRRTSCEMNERQVGFYSALNICMIFLVCTDLEEDGYRSLSFVGSTDVEHHGEKFIRAEKENNYRQYIDWLRSEIVLRRWADIDNRSVDTKWAIEVRSAGNWQHLLNTHTHMGLSKFPKEPDQLIVQLSLGRVRRHCRLIIHKNHISSCNPRQPVDMTGYNKFTAD